MRDFLLIYIRTVVKGLITVLTFVSNA